MSSIDPNTVVGWTVQHAAPNPYSQGGITAAAGALTTTGNGDPGAPGPVSTDVEDILTNSGYADTNPALVTPGTVLAADLVPVPASGSAFTNPAGLRASVVISGGTVTAVGIGPAGGELAEVGTSDGAYLVPPGGQIELTYSAAPTWTWTLL